MSWFVREWFETGRPVPPDTGPPENGSPLFKAIVRRQVLSLDWMRGPLRFWLSAGSSPERLRQRSLQLEWPRIRAAIDDGRLPMVGLIRHHGWNPFDLTKDHQVLAFGYETIRSGRPDDDPPLRPELAEPRRRVDHAARWRLLPVDRRAALRSDLAGLRLGTHPLDGRCRAHRTFVDFDLRRRILKSSDD